MIRLNSRKFFTCNECGGSTDPICDSRYFALAAANKLRLLGVTLGSDCQLFLGSDYPGFAFMGADSQIFISKQPQLSLPSFNTPTGEVYPVGGGFSQLIIANGADPATWYFLTAPSTGDYVLSVEAGEFRLKSPGSAAAQTAVCSADNSVTKGNIVLCKKTGEDGDGNPIYGLKKLAVLDKHVLVGDVDGGTGEVGYKALPSDETLQHELAEFEDLKAGMYRQFDVDTGNTETGGMNVGVSFGGSDPVTDLEIVMYSITTNRFYRAPARVRESVSNPSVVACADNGTFVSMSGHALFAGKTFNYPDFMIFAEIGLLQTDPDYSDIDFGLFIDGILVYTWDVHGSTDNTLSHLYKGVALGVHTVEIRIKQAAKSGSLSVIESNADLISVF